MEHQKRPLEGTVAGGAGAQKSAKTSENSTPKPQSHHDGAAAPITKREWRREDGTVVVPTVLKSESAEAKRFLKKEGLDAFLVRYLPDVPVALDILDLTLLLGFRPSIVDDTLESEAHISKYTKMLQKALNRAMFSRSRNPQLNTVDLALAAIKEAKNIIVLTGAGISTSLGIPDFRSDKGIYSLVKTLNLEDPQQVFDLETFRSDPEIFYNVAHMVLPPENKWTPTHQFIKTLSDKGKLLRNYTQNIDNLEGAAGIPKDQFIQCHGSFATATCRTCRRQIEGSKIYKIIRQKQLPVCPNCKDKRKAKLAESDFAGDLGVMKPDITFFGEDLPQKFYQLQGEDVKKCDLVICIGTSLKVAPVNNIVNVVPEGVPQILINKDDITHSEFDVTLLGYCDEVVTYLSDKLGWKLDHWEVPEIRGMDLRLESKDLDVGIYEISAQKERVPKQSTESGAVTID